MKWLIWSIAGWIGWPVALWAAMDLPKDEVVAVCPSMEVVRADSAPSFIPSVNLLMGSPDMRQPFERAWVKVRGRLMDTRCVPVVGSVVELWSSHRVSTGPTLEGNYTPTLPLYVASPWVSAGAAVSDSLGYITFWVEEAVLGGSRDAAFAMPYLNMHVHRHDHPPIVSKLFLEPPDAPPYMARPVPIARQMLDQDITTYRFNLVFSTVGSDPYRGY